MHYTCVIFDGVVAGSFNLRGEPVIIPNKLTESLYKEEIKTIIKIKNNSSNILYCHMIKKKKKAMLLKKINNTSKRPFFEERTVGPVSDCHYFG